MDQNYPKNIDLNNPDFQNLWNLIQRTSRSVFLTGKAGTGKSTFLKYICAHTRKKHVVLAPTGIAAVNVGGQTLHSFFKIPFKPLLRNDPDYAPGKIQRTMRFPKNKVKLLKELDLIIIDEISMVRADIIDFIDKVLRHFSGRHREPFGGKQLLFVGDIFQLEPVVTSDMRNILSREYNQFFFFNAHVFDALGLVPIELRKIYRQTDNDFINMLDRVRVAHVSDADMRLLNSRYRNVVNPTDDFVITLATRRDTVDNINEEHMDALKTPEYMFEGIIDGNFPVSDLPTSQFLTLKQGAQVIFIRNDKDNRWVNGTIGKVCSLGNDKVEVELEDGTRYNLEQDQWRNIQYTYDTVKNIVVENVLGTFMQYPIKPAWALTVHKSQGLTFNNVVIDFSGGAFTGGQTYVALSRCTSLDGITLLRQLSQRDIFVNPSVLEFARRFNDQKSINNAIDAEQAKSLYLRAAELFGRGKMRDAVKAFAEAQALDDRLQSEVFQRLVAMRLNGITKLHAEIKRLEDVIDAQNKLLRTLAREYTQMGHQSLGYGSLVTEGETAYGGNIPKVDTVAIRTALANYDKALGICPELTEALVGKARLLLSLDEVGESYTLLEKAIAADSKDCDAHMAMAEWHENQGNTSEVLKSYKRAVKADKNRPDPHDALARVYGELGLDDLADEQRRLARDLRKLSQKKRRPAPGKGIKNK